jgi:hypothetical protein
MNRQQRRAAEHAIRKTLQTVPPTPVVPSATAQENPAIDSPAPATTISDAQLIANRKNAAASTGPKTETGKSICRLNAVKTALTGQTVLLPTDDAAEYQKLEQTYINHYKPVGFEEEFLVQSMINADWRLRRIPVFEAGIFAIGRRELAGSVPAEMLEGQIYLKYERQLKNLDLQQNRITRNREKDLARLNQLQSARKEREAIMKRFAAKAQAAAAIGSVFSTSETREENQEKGGHCEVASPHLQTTHHM